jgi:hypothetical protein
VGSYLAYIEPKRYPPRLASAAWTEKFRVDGLNGGATVPWFPSQFAASGSLFFQHKIVH